MEHEKQVEVETLQSEFKIQLGIELKRQAAELSMIKDVEKELVCQNGELKSEQSVLPESPSTEVSSQFMDDNDDPLSASSDIFIQQQLIQKAPGEPSNSVANTDNESDSATQGVRRFYLQQSTLEAALASSSDSADQTGKITVSENLDKFLLKDRAFPALDKPASTHFRQLVDMENEMEKLKKTYEAKVSELKGELEQAEEERTTLIFSHQQEIDNIRKYLNETEEKYDKLMAGRSFCLT